MHEIKNVIVFHMKTFSTVFSQAETIPIQKHRTLYTLYMGLPSWVVKFMPKFTAKFVNLFFSY